MAFFDNLDKNTISVLSALSQMPRAASAPSNAAALSDNDNAATNTLKIMAQDRANENSEKRSILNELAKKKGLYEIGQSYADDEEKKRIQKMALLESNIKEFQSSTGRKPSAQETMVMAGKVGLDIDDMKSLAGSRGGTGGSGGGFKFHTVEDNGVKKTFVEDRDEEGNTTLKPFASNPMETDADRSNQREKAKQAAYSEMENIAKMGGWNPVTEDAEGNKTYNSLDSWIESGRIQGNELAQRANAAKQKYLALGGAMDNGGSGGLSAKDMNIKTAMKQFGYDYNTASGFVDYAQKKTGQLPFSVEQKQTDKAQAGPTNAAQATPANAATTAQNEVVKKSIPETLGTGQGGQNPLTQHFMDNVVNPVKNALTFKSTVDSYNKAYSPSTTQTSGTDKQTQYINTIKDTDFWKNNEDKKGFASMTPSYVKTVLSKDSDLSKQEKKSIWNKLKEEYSTDDKLRELWQLQEKSLDF